MKIILSRKGFDSSFGGCASPIFEDGSLVSLPIPENFKGVPLPARPVTFADIGGVPNIGALVEDLTLRLPRPVKASDLVHLDPDLRKESLPREPGWRPLFGQSHAAQRHLDRQCVGTGDVFLFFGWFREVENREGRFRFKRGTPDRHVFFGWLEVGEVWRLAENTMKVPEWAKMHPHTTPNYGPANTIYVAGSAGSAGTFPRITDELVLTRDGLTRSSWRLPKWFHPSNRRSCLTYHTNVARWQPLEDEYVSLTSVSRGQEFVLDTADYPEAQSWARGLIENNAGERAR